MQSPSRRPGATLTGGGLITLIPSTRAVSYPCTLRSQAVDSAFLQFTVAQTLQRTASVHLLFAFEYVIQASIIVSTFCKYMLALVDRYPTRPSFSRLTHVLPLHGRGPARRACADLRGASVVWPPACVCTVNAESWQAYCTPR